MITLTGREDLDTGTVRASCMLCGWVFVAPPRLALLAVDEHITTEHPA